MSLSWLSDNAVSAGVHSIQEAFVNKLTLIKFSKKDHVKEEGSRYNRNHSAHVYNDITHVEENLVKVFYCTSI